MRCSYIIALHSSIVHDLLISQFDHHVAFSDRGLHTSSLLHNANHSKLCSGLPRQSHVQQYTLKERTRMRQVSLLNLHRGVDAVWDELHPQWLEASEATLEAGAGQLFEGDQDPHRI
jgi:hypothetical protein